MKIELLERLKLPDAVLTRQDLAALGYERRAIDALLRNACVKLPGYSRPLLRVSDLKCALDDNTYRDPPRVRPT